MNLDQFVAQHYSDNSQNSSNPFAVIDKLLIEYKNKYGFSSIIILSSIGLSILSTSVLIYLTKL